MKYRINIYIRTDPIILPYSLARAGKYEFLRMPFGLRNAPATFQRTMQGILHGGEPFSSPYIDDIIIFSNCWEDHLQHIEFVLDCLRRFGLTAKLSKCEWAKQSLQYLGFMVGNGQLSVPQSRVTVIQDYIRPRTVKELKSFLGIMGYYRKFISNFAQQSKCLHSATHKDKPTNIDWTDAMCCAFDYLKSSLCNHVKLTIPKANDIFTFVVMLHCGHGAVLSVYREGVELPVSFYSHQLLDRESRYTATELDCLAVVEGVRHHEVYLQGQKFVTQTDHKSLQSLMTSTHLNRRLWRWAMYLLDFNAHFEYRPGKDNVVADALSRQVWSRDGEELVDLPDLLEENLSESRRGDHPFPRTSCTIQTKEEHRPGRDESTLPGNVRTVPKQELPPSEGGGVVEQVTPIKT